MPEKPTLPFGLTSDLNDFKVLLTKGNFNAASDLLDRNWLDYSQLSVFGYQALVEFLKSAKKQKRYDLITKWAKPTLTLMALNDVARKELWLQFSEGHGGFYGLVWDFPKQWKVKLAPAYLDYARLLSEQPIDDERRDRIKWALRHVEEFDPHAKSEVNKIKAKVERLIAMPKWEYLSLECVLHEGIWKVNRANGQSIPESKARPTSYEYLNQLGNQGWELISSSRLDTKDVVSVLTLIFKRPKV